MQEMDRTEWMGYSERHPLQDLRTARITTVQRFRRNSWNPGHQKDSSNHPHLSDFCRLPVAEMTHGMARNALWIDAPNNQESSDHLHQGDTCVAAYYELATKLESSLVGVGLWAMLEDWVDDSCQNLENELMLLSGSEFKRIALQHRAENPMKASTLIDENPDSDTEDMHPAHGQNSAQMLGTVTKSRRRSSLSAEVCAWPSFIAGNLGLEKLHTLDFNALDHSADDLIIIAAEIFKLLNLRGPLNINENAIQGFLLSVRARMLENPYHNWAHVIDVTQSVYCLASKSGVLASLAPKERLALFLAALCHDLEHPGVSADFLVNTNSNLATLYKNDPGLLEKHHSLRAFELMVCSDTALFHALSAPDLLEVCSTVRDLILATDMSHHSAFLADLQRQQSTRHNEENCDEKDSHLHEMQLLLKCADISNVLKPIAVAKEWAVCVTDEFFHQGDLERAYGLELTPANDRHHQSRAGLQRGFIDYVVLPFISDVVGLWPGLRPLLCQLGANRRAWDGCDDDALMAEVAATRNERRFRRKTHTR